MYQRNHDPVLIGILVVAGLCGGCGRSASSSSPPANAQTSSPGASAAERTIETQTISLQPIAGMIMATGKIAVPEDQMASIGPVHEGRLVRLYAGQGSKVKKGQKLADLESADLDQAEADYLKALADSENARGSSAAEVKLAHANYDRTKMLYEKTITAGKN